MIKMSKSLGLVVLLVVCLQYCVCPPVKPDASSDKPDDAGHLNETLVNDPVNLKLKLSFFFLL